MLCSNPYLHQGFVPFGCGQCLACRLNRRRLWTHRLMLESLSHDQNSFVTLTYDDEHLPVYGDDAVPGTLNPGDMRDFLKRLRKILAPKKIRYYLVGEYGDLTWRPHYHIALFGSNCQESISKAWTFGHVDVGELTDQSAQYIVGYVTKKMTKADDPRLEGRHPEFARMSLKPGIGALAMEKIASALETDYGCDLLCELQDVPTQLQRGTGKFPLGKYLTTKLRRYIGVPEKAEEREGSLQEYFNSLSELYETYAKEKKITSAKKVHAVENRDKLKRLKIRYNAFEKEKIL